MSKVEDVSITNEGIFIPKSLFGENADVTVHKEQSEDGRIRVVVSTKFDKKPNVVVRRLDHALDLSRERRWVEEHREEYAGQWVALDGDKLIANSLDGSQVVKAVKKAGVKKPFIVRVESPDDLPFGGW